MKNDIKISFFGISDMGRQRTNNEDAYIAEELDQNTIIAAAIDGVGGYEGGEVAAEIARTEIPEYLKNYRNGERLELLKQAVVSANNAIFERRQTDEERPNMSCVLTSAIIDINRKAIDMVHVGDTRLYEYHNGELRKLSHDHSLVGYREEVGDLTEEQAMHHPQRNIINRDVGSDRHEVDDQDFLEAEEFPLRSNSVLLFCSDGLTDLVTSNQIVSVLADMLTLEQRAQRLIDAANEAGGKDNITVVLVEYQNDGDEIDGITSDSQNISNDFRGEADKTNESKAPSVKKIIMSVIGALLIAIVAKFMFNSSPVESIGTGVNDTISVDNLGKIIADLKDAVKNDNKKAVAELIEFPLSRPYPLDRILTQEDFINYYDTLFDEKIKSFVDTISAEMLLENQIGSEYCVADSSIQIRFNRALKICNIYYVSTKEMPRITKYIEDEQVGMFADSKGIPWGCYLSADTPLVLKIERVFKDTIGSAYRAFIFHTNTKHVDTLCKQCVFIGYGEVDEKGNGVFVDLHGQELRIKEEANFRLSVVDAYFVNVAANDEQQLVSQDTIMFHKCP